MNSHNPLYIIRGHIAEAAIEAAENDDTARIDFLSPDFAVTLLSVMRAPKPMNNQQRLKSKKNIRLSCSS